MYDKINLNFNFNLNSQALPEDDFDLEQSEQMYAEDSGNILEALSFSVQPDVHPDIPALNLPDEVSKPHDQLELDFGSLDFSSMVEIRRQHETRYAKLAVRTRGTDSDQDPTAEDEKSIKKQFLREYRDILKEEQAQGLSTGKNQQDRWPNNHGASEPEFAEQESSTGNAANASTVAKGAHKEVYRCLIIFYIHTDVMSPCRLSFAKRRYSRMSECHVSAVSRMRVSISSRNCSSMIIS